MKIVFVRHGETAENFARRHQPEKTSLSDNGRTQAAEVALKIRQIAPTHLVSSPLVRALQTASVIGQHIDLIPSISHEAAEIKRPHGLTGHPHRSVYSFLFYCLWYVGLTKTGESYAAFRERIRSVQTYITQLPDDATIVIVSHTVFINLFIAHMCDARPMSPWRAFGTFRQLFKTKNTALIELTYAEIDQGCGWVLSNDLQLTEDLAR